MGQKVSAFALRLGINQPWLSNYFPPKKKQANWLQQDKLIRNYLFTRFPIITQIEIERTETELVIFVHAPNVGLITGESNDSLDIILTKVAQIVNDQRIITKLHLVPEKDIYSSAQAIANDLARQLENRVTCRSALRSLQGVRNFAVSLDGRMDGAEIAQKKKIKQGNMPSSTLDSLIEYGRAEANTAYGQIGITVQLYKGKNKKINYANLNTKKN